MSTLSTHVLDSVTGRPAAGMTITLSQGVASALGDWVVLGSGVTDTDGRLKDWAGAVITAGMYRLVFETGSWFSQRQRTCFYPEVVVTFTVEDDGHHHVPLLLAPYAYSTYRGS